MLSKYNGFFVNFDLGHKNGFKKNLKNTNISGVIGEESIKFEQAMAGNVIKVYVNTVEISTLIWNNVKDLLSLYSFPKVTESVLNTNNFSAYKILIIIELGLILVLYRYTKENKINKTGLCKISKSDYENKKGIFIILGLAIENVFLILKIQAFIKYILVNLKEKDIFSAEGILNIRFFPHLSISKTPLQIRKGKHDKWVDQIRVAYFYKFSFLLFYIILLVIWQLFSPFILARISLMFNVFSISIRTYALQDKNIFAKYALPLLKFLTKSRICCRILLFCANFSDEYFGYKYPKIITVISLISKAILYFGLLTRPLIAVSYAVPYAELFLLLFAINGVFRAILNLGLLLTSGDPIIKQFVQGVIRRVGRIIPPVPPNPQNTPTPPEEPNNNDKDNKKDSEDNNTDSKNKEKNTREQKVIYNPAIITSAIALGGLVIAGVTYYEQYSEAAKEEKARLENEKKERHQELREDKERRHQEKIAAIREGQLKKNDESHSENMKKKLKFGLTKLTNNKKQNVPRKSQKEKNKKNNDEDVSH